MESPRAISGLALARGLSKNSDMLGAVQTSRKGVMLQL